MQMEAEKESEHWLVGRIRKHKMVNVEVFQQILESKQTVL